MIKALRSAVDSLAARQAPDDTPTAVAVQARRQVATLLEGDIPARDKTDEQLNAYRGTVYAATDKISRRVAGLRIKLLQVKVDSAGEEERTEVLVHPFLSLLGRGSRSAPHEEYSVYELKQTTSISLDLTGEAWWLTERNLLGVPGRITPIAGNRITVAIVKETGLIGGYFFRPKGAGRDQAIFIAKVPFAELQKPGNLQTPFMTFFRYPSPRGIEDPRGWSPVKAAAYAYDINLYEMIYKKTFLEQGAQLGGILESTVTLNRDQIDEYMDQFKAKHGGPEQAGLPLILPPALKWHTTEPSPRDMQWAEALKLTSEQILQIYGVSDAKLGRADIGSRATAHAQDFTFNREVIASRLELIQAKLDQEFLPVYPGQSDELHFDCEWEDPVPADPELGLKQEEQDVKLNIRMRNEVREERGLDPMGEFGDLAQVGMSTMLIDTETGEEVPTGGEEEEEKPAEEEEEETEVEEAYTEIEPRDCGADLGLRLLSVQAASDGFEAAIVARGEESRAQMSAWRQAAADPRVIRLSEILGEATHDRFFRRTRPVILTVLDEEGRAAWELAGGEAGKLTMDAVKAQWMGVLKRHIVSVDGETAKLFRLSLIEGIEAGETTDLLVARVDRVVEQATGYRSDLIARTEVNGATGHSTHEAYKQAGAPYKGWVTQMDGHQRATHDDADGQIVPIDQGFSVGSASLRHPCDPDGPAEEVINCRCAEIPEYQPSRSRWTQEQRAAIWRRYVRRLSHWEARLRPRLQREFRLQGQDVTVMLREFDELSA